MATDPNTQRSQTTIFGHEEVPTVITIRPDPIQAPQPIKTASDFMPWLYAGIVIAILIGLIWWAQSGNTKLQSNSIHDISTSSSIEVNGDCPIDPTTAFAPDISRIYFTIRGSFLENSYISARLKYDNADGTFTLVQETQRPINQQQLNFCAAMVFTSTSSTGFRAGQYIVEYHLDPDNKGEYRFVIQ